MVVAFLKGGNMNTHDFKTTAGTPNIVLNRKELEKRALLANMPELLVEELSDTELEKQVNFRELKGE
jgi:hypothetical protein